MSYVPLFSERNDSEGIILEAATLLGLASRKQTPNPEAI
jgi:hypothetical protein